MLHVFAMLLTFVATAPARLDAGLEHRGDYLDVTSCSARGDSSGSKADVSAVKVEADALAKVCDHLLGKASVSAGSANLPAVQHRLNCADQRVVRLALHVGVRRNHFMNAHDPVLAIAEC
jgi:hypothetical protein